MSTSIYTPRRRGRKTSVSFQSLYWLVRRVAVWQLLFPHHTPREAPATAILFLRKNWKHLDMLGRTELARRPDEMPAGIRRSVFPFRSLRARRLAHRRGL